MTSADKLAIDEVFRLVNRPVWIVTAAHGPRRGGLLATWVAQCSLDVDRPMLLAGLAPNHFTTELVLASQSLAAHLIMPAQIDLAWRFGLGLGRERDKLAGLAVSVGQTGSPVLADCLAWLECRVLSQHDTGDRLYFWAEVVAGRRMGCDPPLAERELLAAATGDQLRQLRANLLADIDLLRSARDTWRARHAGPAETGIERSLDQDREN